jgi:hypothetical protein
VQDGKNRIIHITEARGPIRAGVMKPPGNVESDSDLIFRNQACTLKRASRVKAGPLPETGEYRVISGAKAMVKKARGFSPA